MGETDDLHYLCSSGLPEAMRETRVSGQQRVAFPWGETYSDKGKESKRQCHGHSQAPNASISRQAILAREKGAWRGKREEGAGHWRLARTKLRVEGASSSQRPLHAHCRRSLDSASPGKGSACWSFSAGFIAGASGAF